MRLAHLLAAGSLAGLPLATLPARAQNAPIPSAIPSTSPVSQDVSGTLPLSVTDGPLAGLGLGLGIASTGTSPTVSSLGLNGQLIGYETSLRLGADGRLGASLGTGGVKLKLESGPTSRSVGLGYSFKFE